MISRIAVFCCVLLFLAAPSQAQEGPRAFTDLGASSDEPIEIIADSLEVRDKESLAIFKGNVEAIQGETKVNTAVMRVYYAEREGGAAAPGGGQDINRIEVSGGVIIRSQDQQATANSGVVHVADNQAVLVGDVVLTQGSNVALGDTLTIDLTSGESVLSAKADTRVRVRVVPGQKAVE